MQDIKTCQKIKIKQGAFCFGNYDEKTTCGYLELNPHSSLELHKRGSGIEHLTQVKGKCVMVVFDKSKGTNHLLVKGEKLTILPKGVLHIHANPFNKKSLTYFYFKGNIKHIIDKIIKDGAE